MVAHQRGPAVKDSEREAQLYNKGNRSKRPLECMRQRPSHKPHHVHGDLVTAAVVLPLLGATQMHGALLRPMRADRYPFIDLTSQMVAFWGCTKSCTAQQGYIFGY